MAQPQKTTFKKGKNQKKEKVERNHLRDNIEAPRKVTSNPPQIDYSVFSKTQEEKDALKAAKSS